MNERERIEFIMKCYNLTPSMFADKVGIQRASVSHILSGRNKVSLDIIQKIHIALPDVDLEWLMTGNGVQPAFQKEQQVSADIAAEPLLFGSYDDGGSSENIYPQSAVRQPKSALPSKSAAARMPRRTISNKGQNEKDVENVKRIKEIRIFYSDGTYETLFPEK